MVQGRLIPRSNCGVDFSFVGDAIDRHVLLSPSIKSIPSGVAVSCVQASHDPLLWLDPRAHTEIQNVKA